MGTPNPECKICGGLGSVEAENLSPHPPSFRRCECALRKDILANVERSLAGLSLSPVIPTTPLLGKHEKNLHITAGVGFKAHLRHVMIRQPITFSARVASDAELMTAWLASIALAGKDILDPDAYTVSTEFLTLTDLATPADLLIIRMGVKVARNVAASEVLAEAINIRRHENKPTWIWDEPHAPLNPGHLFWSDAVGRLLVTSFEHINDLSTPTAPRGPGRAKAPDLSAPRAAPGRKTLRGDGK